MAKKVLIIDDSITQLSSLKIFFRRAGFEVETAQNGVEGFVKVYKTTPDLIISDVLMPHLGGFQLCRLLKSNPETKQIPIIVLTVLDKKLDKFWASQSGANRFIQKDSDFKNIIQIAEEICEEFPVSQRYKETLKTFEFDEEGIIPQINKILDDALMKSTITNKFRDLTDYTSDDRVIADKIFKILLNRKLMSKNTVAMDNYPLSSIYELLLLSKGVQKNIKKIFAPALIVHSLEDDLTSTKSAKFVFNNISSFYKEYMELKDSYHLVLYDNEKEKVYNKTMEFIDALSYKRNINLKELRDRKK